MTYSQGGGLKENRKKIARGLYTMCIYLYIIKSGGLIKSQIQY